MIRHKIVLVGALGVGKTSLVRRYISDEFSERYVATLGVRVEKRELVVDQRDVELLIWDIGGDEDFRTLRGAYLKGASGILYVADQHNVRSIEQLLDLREHCEESLTQVPTLTLLNKNDLTADPHLSTSLSIYEFPNVLRTSAKTGENVAMAFADLAQAACA